MYEGSSASSVSISASRSAAVDFAWLDTIHAARIWSAASIITSGETISPPTQLSIPRMPSSATLKLSSLGAYSSVILPSHRDQTARTNNHTTSALPHGPFGRGAVSLGPPMSIRLDPDLKDILQELANAEDRSLNSYISRALRKHVEAIKRRP